MCAGSSTDFPPPCLVTCIRCHVSYVTCHISHFTICVSRVTCHMSQTPTATAMDHPPANSPTIHSSMFRKDLQINFFFPQGIFFTIYKQKFIIWIPLFFHKLSLRNSLYSIILTSDVCKWELSDFKKIFNILRLRLFTDF